MNVRMDAKYYSVYDALKMLPYIKGYCRDIKKCYKSVEKLTERNRRLSNLTSADRIRKEKIEEIREKIRIKVELLTTKFKRWREELKELYITVCSVQHGRVDIPVYCSGIEAVMSLCVTPETTLDDIEWHLVDESHEQARRYFEKVY